MLEGSLAHHVIYGGGGYVVPRRYPVGPDPFERTIIGATMEDVGFDGSTTPEDMTPEQITVALDAVRRQVQSFARELVSSLQFYQNQPGSLGIGEIVLTGGTAHLPGLAEELERLIGVHVRVGDPFARLKVGKRFAGTEQIGSLAVAIGLGIED